MPADVKLYLGDCLEILPTLETGSVDAVVTDPPYGTTACKWDAVIPFDAMWAELKRIIKPSSAVVLFGSQPFTSFLVTSNPDWFKYEWIWEKNRGSNFANAKTMPMKEHENIMVFGNGAMNYHPIPARRSDGGRARAAYPINPSNTGKREVYSGMLAKDTWTIDPDTRVPRSVLKYNTEVGSHPTQKPVPLLDYLIRTYTVDGETVLDFTMGSGTTGVACVQTGRNFIGIEIDPTYYAIAEKRIAEAQLQLRMPL